jgi:hypothetical protein
MPRTQIMKTAKLMALACLLFAWIATPISAASAEPMGSPDPAAALGNDISWPQCGAGLPAGQAFAIVGVNGGRPDNANPCFAEQLAWAASSAGGTSQPPVALYVNTANPAGAGWWPVSTTVAGVDVPNPYGICDGSASAACAYVHGYAMAYDDVNSSGISEPAKRLWWLDVETGNAWSWDTVANAADLEGMTAYLQGIGAEVGIYSTSYQFGIIAGQPGPGSRLNGLKSWVAGATSTDSAAEFCSASPLTAGSVVALTQFTAGDFDYNYSCIPPAPPAPPAPVMAPPKPAGPALTEDANGRRKPLRSIPQN